VGDCVGPAMDCTMNVDGDMEGMKVGLSKDGLVLATWLVSAVVGLVVTSKEDGAPDSEAAKVLTVGLKDGMEDEGSVDGLLLGAVLRAEG
jgi:hypothetical protein